MAEQTKCLVFETDLELAVAAAAISTANALGGVMGIHPQKENTLLFLEFNAEDREAIRDVEMAMRVLYPAGQ